MTCFAVLNVVLNCSSLSPSLSVHSFRPDLPVQNVQSALGFTCLDTCLAFLAGLGVTYYPSDPSKIDCKASSAAVAAS